MLQWHLQSCQCNSLTSITSFSTCCDCKDIRCACAEKLWEAGCRGRGAAIVSFVLAGCLPAVSFLLVLELFPQTSSPDLTGISGYKRSDEVWLLREVRVKVGGVREQIQTKWYCLRTIQLRNTPQITIHTSVIRSQRGVQVKTASTEQHKRYSDLTKNNQINVYHDSGWGYPTVSHCSIFIALGLGMVRDK